jgi:hypothetical protein
VGWLPWLPVTDCSPHSDRLARFSPTREWH